MLTTSSRLFWARWTFFVFRAVPDEKVGIQDGVLEGVIEAMAAGLPGGGLPASDDGALIEDGKTGALMPASDVQGLARGAQLLLGDDLVRSEISARASRSADRFSIDACVSETVSPCKSLLAAVGASA